jgi:small-conductance mechanosensitive channel
VGTLGFGQFSDQIQKLTDALTSSQVTGWDVVVAIGVLVVAYPVGILARKLTTRALRRVPNLPDSVSTLGGRIARWLVLLIALAWGLSLLGVTVGWVVIVVGFVVIVGFLMVKPMIESTAAGLLLEMRPSFSESDLIQTAGYLGTVVKIDSRTTVLQTNDGRRVHVPNTEVLSQPIVVYSAYDSRKATFEVRVDHDTDLDEATRRLVDAISGVAQVEKEPAPAVQATGFADNAITLSVGYWYPSSLTSDLAVTDGVIRAVKGALTKAGIELAVPALHIDKGPPAAANDDGDNTTPTNGDDT